MDFQPNTIEMQEIPLFPENSGNVNANGNQADVQQPQAAISEQERAYRAMQSEKDQVVAQLQKAKQAEDFWTNFATDKEFRRSVVAEYEPELIKSPDPTSSIKENLAKEFGDDFEYKLDNGSAFERMQIQNRYQELKSELGKVHTAPKPLKELVAERKAKVEAEQKAFEQEIANVRTELGMQEHEWNGFQDWASKVNTKYLASQYLKATRGKTKPNMPSFNSVQGTVNNQPTEIDNLSKTFGNPQQEFSPNFF